MSGDPKLDASQVLPDFPYAEYARLLGLHGDPRRPPGGRRARAGTRRWPPAARRCSRSSPTPRCRRCRRTSASSRPRAWRKALLRRRPGAAGSSRSRSRASSRSSRRDERRVDACCATSAAAAMQRLLSGGHGGERAAARRSRSTSTTTAARSATSGCGRRSCSSPAAGRRRASPASSPSARRARCCPRCRPLFVARRRWPASFFHLRGAARKPGGLQRGDLQPRHGPAGARARLADDGRRHGPGGGARAPGALRWRTRSASADHLPKRRGDRPAADPAGLPRQRRGTTPQMHGRYPDYDVLANAAPLGRGDPRRVVLARVERRAAAALLRRATRRAALRALPATSSWPRTPSRASRCSRWSTPSSTRGRLDGYPLRRHARRPRHVAAGRCAGSTRRRGAAAPTTSPRAGRERSTTIVDALRRRATLARRRLGRARRRRGRGRSSCAARWRRSTRTRGRGTRSASAARPTRAATCACSRRRRARAVRGARGVRRSTRSPTSPSEA